MSADRKDPNVIRFDRCPQCAARGRDRHGDNLGIWPDGHQYCFSCHYYVPPTKWANVFHQISAIRHEEKIKKTGENVNGPSTLVSLPPDCNNSIPVQGLNYLRKYGLTNSEIAENGLLWSQTGIFVNSKKVQASPLVIFPYYGFGRLQGWVGRNLGETVTDVKSIRIGMKWPGHSPILHVHGGGILQPACGPKTLVVVEDPVSAIKVRRHANAMPLFGSTFDEERMLILSKNYDTLLLWLDYDKAAFSRQEAKNYSNKFRAARSIVTKQDPKDMDDGELRMNLRSASVDASSGNI